LLLRRGGTWHASFDAMGSPCEVLIDGGDEAAARHLGTLAQAEALRIERKYSRYRADSELQRLNTAGGQPVTVDEETAALLDFAATCHALSGGLFDVTSGVLRAVWRFDGSGRVPDAAAVAALLPRVGWSRVQWGRPVLTLPADMELDLGGIGKEYAVDRVRDLLVAAGAPPVLVNFGGDLAVSGPRAQGQAWQVGIERPQAGDAGPAARQRAALVLDIHTGALATSGDARRFLMHRGERLGHVLDPRDGWPVRGAPRSVTVAAGRCTEAGLLSTLALLQGPGAEAFLQAQGLPHWVLR
jgi:thiamine biosynthesis lipoprotein